MSHYTGYYNDISVYLLSSFEMFQLESCGIVSNPEKSRLSRPIGQSGFVPKPFRDRTNRIGTVWKKIEVPNFVLIGIFKQITRKKYKKEIRGDLSEAVYRGVLQDIPESRKIPFVLSCGTNGILRDSSKNFGIETI